MAGRERTAPAVFDPLMARHPSDEGFGDVVAVSAAMREACRLARKLAGQDIPVVLERPTGAGKSFFAEAMHGISPRAGRPFVSLACGAAKPETIESELFGHTEGAYTGAVSARDGVLRCAQDGTVFLDDLDCLPLEVQPRLLRVIESGRFRPLGSDEELCLRARWIVATATPLAELVRSGRLRADLNYRIAGAIIRIPPVSERREDIPYLVARKLAGLCPAAGRPIPVFADGAFELILGHPWPGGVRQLFHFLELLLALTSEPRWTRELVAAHLPPAEPWEPQEEIRPLKEAVRAYVRKVVRQVPSRREAARLLGISTSRLRRILESGPEGKGRRQSNGGGRRSSRHS
jgi:DNA-binding NtrC family response regulator